MRARGDEDALLRRHERPPAEPGRRRVAVARRTAEALVAQQRSEVGAHGGEPVAHMRDEIGIVGLGRHIHGKVSSGESVAGLPAHDRVAPYERATANDGLNEAALARFHIPTGHGGKVEGEFASELALRRQPVAWGEPPLGDVVGDRVSDGKVARAVPALQGRRPGLQHHPAPPRKRPIDCIMLRSPRFRLGRRIAQKVGPVFMSLTPHPIN